MSVFGGIVLFTLGVATGGGLVIGNRVAVQRETAQLRRENEHLKTSAWKDRLEYETTRAYHRGYKEGRLSPANDAEKFVQLVEDRGITLGGQGRRRRAQAERDEE